MNRIVIDDKEFVVGFKSNPDERVTECFIKEGDLSSPDPLKRTIAIGRATRYHTDLDNRVVARTQAFKKALDQLREDKIVNRRVRKALGEYVNIRKQWN